MKKVSTLPILKIFFVVLMLVLIAPHSINAQGGITCTGCTRTVTVNTGTVTVNPGDTVCLNSSNFTGNIVVNGGTLKICGTAVPSAISYNNGSNQATIINNNSLTLNDFSANGNVVLVNRSVLRFPANLSLRGNLVNHQFVEAGGSVNVNSGGNLSNGSGALFQVRGSLTSNDQIFNEGTLDVRGNFANNSTGRVVNTGTTTIGANLTNDGTFINRLRVTVGGSTQINSGGLLSLGFLNTGALFTTQNLNVDGRIEGVVNACSSVRVSSRTVINSSAILSGRVDICDANGIEILNIRIVPPVTANCSCQIPISGRSGSIEETLAEELNAYPSPFIHTFTIEYTLKQSSVVNLTLYTASGVKVKDLIVDEVQSEGDHIGNYDGGDLVSGIYIYVLQIGTSYRSGKVVKK